MPDLRSKWRPGLFAEPATNSVLPFNDLEPSHSRKTILIATLEYSIPTCKYNQGVISNSSRTDTFLKTISR